MSFKEGPINIAMVDLSVGSIESLQRMQRARNAVARWPYMTAEQLFPSWPGLRALMVLEVPHQLHFHQSPMDANVMELNYEWARRIRALAPTVLERDALDALYADVTEDLKPCFPFFDFESFRHQPMRAATYAHANTVMYAHDRHCQARGVPTIMDLWKHCLGMRQAFPGLEWV